MARKDGSGLLDKSQGKVRVKGILTWMFLVSLLNRKWICKPISDISVGQSYGSEGPRSPNSESQQDALSMLLAEIRSLRIQLEKSIETNNALRLRLEEQLSRPASSPSQSPSRSQGTFTRRLNFSERKGGEDIGTVESVTGRAS